MLFMSVYWVSRKFYLILSLCLSCCLCLSTGWGRKFYLILSLCLSCCLCLSTGWGRKFYLILSQCLSCCLCLSTGWGRKLHLILSQCLSCCLYLSTGWGRKLHLILSLCLSCCLCLSTGWGRKLHLILSQCLSCCLCLSTSLSVRVSCACLPFAQVCLDDQVVKVLALGVGDLGIKPLFLGAQIAQLVVCWACCPAWCSITGLTLFWAFDRGDFSLGVNMGSDSIPPKLFRMRV